VNGEPKTARGAWFATLCALVALAASGLGLFWDFLPQFRPDPLEVVGADVQIAAVEPDVSLGDWLRRAHPRDYEAAGRALFGREPSESELEQPGELIYARIQVDGHKHQNVSLTYRLFRRKDEKVVVLPSLPEPAASRVTQAHLSAPSERSVQLLWMASLEGEDDMFIRMELRDDRGLLAVTDSATLHDGRLVR
jgi:hypothetical protein